MATPMVSNVSARLAALVLFVLAGCADEADVYAIIQDRAYTPSEFRFAAANKAFRTNIAGNPFKQAPTRAVHDAVLVAMQPGNWWQPLPFTPRTQFTDAPNGQNNSRYHVVVALNPDEAQISWYDAPCAADSAPPTLGPHDGVTVRMVFCRDEAPLSISQGTLRETITHDDKRFRRMITRVTMALFPQRRDDRDCFGAGSKGRC